jgi:glycosyltransferase involved in cell wall biosynthesis
LIVYVGRLAEEKGPDILLEAMGLLPRRLRQTTCMLFVGEGPMAQQLQQRVRRMGLEGNVRFLGFRQDVHRYLAAADVAVVPSRHEIFGLSLVQAMACGCAVVATRTGGLESILRDPSHGVLVEPNDPAALSKALVRLLDRPDLRERMGLCARAHVVSHYASSRVLETLRELIVSVVGGPKLAQRLTHEMPERYRYEHRSRPAVR